MGAAGPRDAERFHRQVHGSTRDPGALEKLAAGAVVVEARGTFCPEPVIRIQNRARDLDEGQVAVLLADDAGVELDVPAWCISTGNEYLGLLRHQGYFRVFIRKRPRRAIRSSR